MRIFAKIVTALGLASAAAASPASAMSNPDFVNRHTDAGQVSALQMALRTEAYRADQAGQHDRAVCIANNFVTVKGYDIPSAFDALTTDVLNMRDPQTQTEDLVASAIDKSCGKDQLAKKIQIPEHPPAGDFTAKNFFDTFKIAQDKKVVLALPIATQISRLKQNNPDYAQCVQTNFGVDDDTKKPPPGFSAIINRLIANDASASGEPVEQTILNAIAAQCGSETAPLAPKVQ